MRTKKFMNVTMMIWNDVESESGHWSVILVNASQNNNEMTEKAVSGNGVETREEHLSMRKQDR